MIEDEDKGVILDSWVRDLVGIFLDSEEKDLVVIEDESDVDDLCKVEDIQIKVAWIKGSAEDAVFYFWRLLKEKKLAKESYWVFTEQLDSPAWRDLSVYDSIKFGSLVLMHCKANTKPIVVPSQRGIFMD
jgi:hypothetical protein